MAQPSSKKHGTWDGKLKFKSWNGKVPKWIQFGRNLKFMYEDLRLVVKRVSGCSNVEVRVSNHDYEDGKIPMLYLVVERGNESALKGL